MEWHVILLILLTLYFLFRWLCAGILLIAYRVYLKKKQYTLPTNEEKAECVRLAFKILWKIMIDKFLK